MSQRYGPYHRLGELSGPGCPVSVLSITTTRGKDGAEMPGHLLDAGSEVTELELLRTIASGLGVHWGRDDLGWWAAVPSATADAAPADRIDPRTGLGVFRSGRPVTQGGVKAFEDD
ncbi:MAG: hypothetical protein LBI48_08505 [Burkholderiaceae bacterium]|jgi:hypothetical protein|nr:hypothetical protein [Burkholderiaceae bacterium]